MMTGLTLIFLVSCAFSATSGMDASTEMPMIMDDVFDDIGTLVDMVMVQSGLNSTVLASDDVDVDEFYLGMNGTVFVNGTGFNDTERNSTSSNGTAIIWQDPAKSAACLRYRQNPYWRLTSTQSMVLDYMCVCYAMCYTEEDVKMWHELANTNRTEKNIFQTNPFFLFYLVFVTYIITALFGTTANIVVIVGLLGIMKDKTVVNRFVVSLAAADLFTSVVITPVKLLYLTQVMRKMYFTWLCKILLYLRQIAQAEAIVILTIVAFERYYAICHPLKAKFRCSMKRCHILILLSWVVSLILTLPTVISAQYKADRGTGASCTLHYDNPTWLQVHYLYYLLLLLIVPTVIMTFTYSRICLVLWKSTKKAAELTNQDGKEDKKSPSEVQARIKVIRTMIGLLIVFVVCWGPRLSFNVISTFHWQMTPLTRYYADMVVELVAIAHSLINPVMFILFSQSFRQAFAKRLPAWCCRHCLLLASGSSGTSSSASAQTVSSTDGLKSTEVNGGSSNHI